VAARVAGAVASHETAIAAPAPAAGTDLAALTAVEAVRALVSEDFSAENYARAAASVRGSVACMGCRIPSRTA